MYSNHETYVCLKRCFITENNRFVCTGLQVNNFGGRLAGNGCFVFNRKSDLLRAAFMVAVERHLHPPPHKYVYGG